MRRDMCVVKQNDSFRAQVRNMRRNTTRFIIFTS